MLACGSVCLHFCQPVWERKRTKELEREVKQRTNRREAWATQAAVRCCIGEKLRAGVGAVAHRHPDGCTFLFILKSPDPSHLGAVFAFT